MCSNGQLGIDTKGAKFEVPFADKHGDLPIRGAEVGVMCCFYVFQCLRVHVMLSSFVVWPPIARFCEVIIRV